MSGAASLVPSDLLSNPGLLINATILTSARSVMSAQDHLRVQIETRMVAQASVHEPLFRLTDSPALG